MELNRFEPPEKRIERDQFVFFEEKLGVGETRPRTLSFPLMTSEGVTGIVFAKKMNPGSKEPSAPLRGI